MRTPYCLQMKRALRLPCVFSMDTVGQHVDMHAILTCRMSSNSNSEILGAACLALDCAVLNCRFQKHPGSTCPVHTCIAPLLTCTLPSMPKPCHVGMPAQVPGALVCRRHPTSTRAERSIDLCEHGAPNCSMLSGAGTWCPSCGRRTTTTRARRTTSSTRCGACSPAAATTGWVAFIVTKPDALLVGRLQRAAVCCICGTCGAWLAVPLCSAVYR